MKRVRCPKCDSYIIFDETKYENGQSLVFQCNDCGKQFAIRMGGSKLHNRRKDERPEEEADYQGYGHITVIENQFHFKQVIPLHSGDNIIGKYAKGNEIDAPIETSDPSVDLHHCILNVGKDKNGKLKYVLRDGPSYTGTFVGDEILADRERRIIGHGTLFTLGATSIILYSDEEQD